MKKLNDVTYAINELDVALAAKAYGSSHWHLEHVIRLMRKEDREVLAIKAQELVARREVDARQLLNDLDIEVGVRPYPSEYRLKQNE